MKEYRVRDLGTEERKQIVLEEKQRLRNEVAQLTSKELDHILDEESPLRRRGSQLRILFEILIGTYIGVISILLILIISDFLP